MFRDDVQMMDVEQMEADMVAAARRLVSNNPLIGAIVLGCTNMASYAHAVQQAVGLPIFDIQTLIHMAYRTRQHQSYAGHL